LNIRYGIYLVLGIKDDLVILSKYARIAPQLCWGDEWPTLSPGDCVVIRDGEKVLS